MRAVCVIVLDDVASDGEEGVGVRLYPEDGDALGVEVSENWDSRRHRRA